MTDSPPPPLSDSDWEGEVICSNGTIILWLISIDFTLEQSRPVLAGLDQVKSSHPITFSAGTETCDCQLSCISSNSSIQQWIRLQIRKITLHWSCFYGAGKQVIENNWVGWIHNVLGAIYFNNWYDRKKQPGWKDYPSCYNNRPSRFKQKNNDVLFR